MFFTTTRALALVVIGTVALTAHAERGSGNAVFVETHGGGTAEVYTYVSSDAGSQVDIVATVNGETVIDIHEESDSKPIEVHEVYESSTDEQRARTRSHVARDMPAPPLPPPPAPPLFAPQDPPLPIVQATTAPRTELREPAHTFTSITNSTYLTNDAIAPGAYVADEEPHDDPLVTRIMRSIAHTLTYVFTIFF
jgi:hypothetical protein